MTPRTPVRIALAAVALLAACDSPTGSGGPPAAATVVSGDLQTQTVNKPLANPLVVKITDASGNPVRGRQVNWSTLELAGALESTTTVTDRNGQATNRWTLGLHADTQRVVAHVVDPATGADLVAATFRALATPDAPASITAQGPSSFSGLPGVPLADSVAALVRDVYGNGIPGATVVWTVIKGGGSVSPATTTTQPNGVARTSWTLGSQLDSMQVIEAAAGLTLKTQFTANGQVPGDAVILRVSGDAQADTAGQVLPQPLVVRVQRGNGTPLAGVPVTFTLPAGSGSVSPATAVSNASGQVSVQWTLGPAAGAMSATASISTGSSTTFHATAVVPQAVYMRFLAPAADAVVGDAVQVTVAVDSASASVASVVARAGGNSVTLQPGLPGQVTGTLSLVGVPHGAVALRVTATTVNGDSAIITRNIVHDTPPVVTITAPHMGTVARPGVRVDVDCVDDSGQCQLTLTGATYFFGNQGGQSTVFTAVNSIHQDVSMAAFEGKDVRLRIIASDAAGHQQTSEYEIPVESSARLTPIVSGGDRLLDFDATRLLTGDQSFSCCIGGQALPWAVRLVDRATGNAVAIDSGGFTRAFPLSYQGWLHPAGAAYAVGGGVKNWRSGTFDGPFSAPYEVAGGWLVAESAPAYNSTSRLELATGAKTFYTGQQADVAENGDVALRPDSGITWHHGATAITVAAVGQYPVTDGINVAYVDAANHAVLYLGAGGTADLGPIPAFTDDFRPSHRLLEVENGWTAWVRPDGGGIGQVWARSPAGDVRQLTSGGQTAEIVSLGAAGQVVYSTGGQVYVAQYPYAAAPVRVFADMTSTGLGRIYQLRWRGSQLLLFLGRTAFDVSY